MRIKQKRSLLIQLLLDHFLELENKSFLKQIEEDKIVIAQKDAESKRINEERAKAAIATKVQEGRVRNTNSATAKSSDRNNIAFKCNYCDGGKSKEFVGYKGVCSDETIKYNIKVAKHIWCSQPENMCYKYLNGEISREEICKFYEETKSEFSKSVCYESQMLEIWNAGAGKIIFGSGLHRYITDIQAAQVLKKICEIKKGTSGEMISKEFLEHYCRIKGMDIDSIPIPNGALQRVKR